MGFTMEVEDGQRARLVAATGGDPLNSFIEAIRDGLNQRITSFTVDLTRDPPCLAMIMEPLKKLQVLVKSRGQSVQLIGSGLGPTSQLVTELRALGVAFPDVEANEKRPEVEAINAPLSADEEALVSEELKIVFKELDTDFGGELILPEPARVAPYLSAVQSRLATLLKMEEALKAEEATLSRRVNFLKKRETGNSQHMPEYEELMQEERAIDKLRDMIPKLKKELIVAKEAAENQERVFKEYTNRLDNENKKKQEALKRELEQLKSNHQKIQAELNKKAKAAPSGQGES